ncbi:MAG: hypothetical protein JXR97_04810 [Planctomycetes bacterium]|nr:hypothetical protein [Planctomycetota bacterium]
MPGPGISLHGRGVNLKNSLIRMPNPWHAPGSTSRPAPAPQKAKAAEHNRGPQHPGLGASRDVTA